MRYGRLALRHRGISVVAWTWKLVEKLSVNENYGDNDDDAVDI